MQFLLLAVAFILEIVAFIGFASLAFLLPVSPGLQFGAWLLLLLLVGCFWGIYMAPKSKRRLQARPYYIAKAVLYVLAAFGLGSIVLGISFLGLAVATELFLYNHHTDKN